jgi:dephospho-CoA kinase
MKLIGIVGGIASGKSFVSRAFQDLGAKWINADAMVHDAYRRPEVLQRLQDRWGTLILDQHGQLDRSKVADLVFEPSAEGRRELEWLESLLHPLLRQQILQQLQTWRSSAAVPAVILDAPVLLKAGWDTLCDELIFVAASESTRWSRIQQRGWTRQQWEQREALQTPLAEKQARATAVINNDGTAEETERQVRQFWERSVVGSS